MTLKEYKAINKLTVRELTDELRNVDPRFTPAMVSNMANGVVDPPEAVKAWLAGKQIAMNEEPLTEEEDIVLRCLTGHFKDKPMERGELKYWTGLSDRIMRKAIEGLRNRGYWILNDGYGYYITFNREDLEPWINKERARARSINRTVQAMLSRVSGQTEMGKE